MVRTVWIRQILICITLRHGVFLISKIKTIRKLAEEYLEPSQVSILALFRENS